MTNTIVISFTEMPTIVITDYNYLVSIKEIERIYKSGGGVGIEFENTSKETKDMFYKFIEELHGRRK